MPHGKKPPSHSNKKKKKRSPMNAVSDTGVGETTNLPESVDASMPHRAVEHQQEVARRHEDEEFLDSHSSEGTLRFNLHRTTF
jgi:hypothetical protein